MDDVERQQWRQAAGKGETWGKESPLSLTSTASTSCASLVSVGAEPDRQPSRAVRFSSDVSEKIIYSEWQEALICSCRGEWAQEREDGGDVHGLIEFVQELYKGVEVVIKKDSWFSNKGRHGILFSEDEGHTLSWLETGGSLKVQQVPSRFLVDLAELPHKKGALKLRYRAKSTGTQEKTVIFEQSRVENFSRFKTGLKALVRLNSDFVQ